ARPRRAHGAPPHPRRDGRAAVRAHRRHGPRDRRRDVGLRRVPRARQGHSPARLAPLERNPRGGRPSPRDPPQDRGHHRRRRMNERPLYKALLEAQRQLTTIGHDDKNKFDGYRYTSSEHMIGQVRSVLLANGLVFSETGSRTQPIDEGRAIVESTFFLAHAASGDSVEIVSSQVALPGNGRPLDKAVAGARTVNIGYAL